MTDSISVPDSVLQDAINFVTACASSGYKPIMTAQGPFGTFSFGLEQVQAIVAYRKLEADKDEDLKAQIRAIIEGDTGDEGYRLFMIQKLVAPYAPSTSGDLNPGLEIRSSPWSPPHRDSQEPLEG